MQYWGYLIQLMLNVKVIVVDVRGSFAFYLRVGPRMVDRKGTPSVVSRSLDALLFFDSDA